MIATVLFFKSNDYKISNPEELEILQFMCILLCSIYDMTNHTNHGIIPSENCNYVGITEIVI